MSVGPRRNVDCRCPSSQPYSALGPLDLCALLSTKGRRRQGPSISLETSLLSMEENHRINEVGKDL